MLDSYLSRITVTTIKSANPGDVLSLGRWFPGDGRVVLWVAVRGGAVDWAVYVNTPNGSNAITPENVQSIIARGEKVFPNTRHWPKNISATTGALDLYRA